MSSKIIFTKSPEETMQVAREFTRTLKKGDWVALSGELGSGKTCFAKGAISELAKIPVEEIPSPSFTLVEEYETPSILYHVDLYRLPPTQVEQALPWDELLSPEVITFIEWPERFPRLQGHCQWGILLSKEGEETLRKIEIVEQEPHGRS